MAFKIKRGDTRPVYVANLKDDYLETTEAPLDLTNATTITFKMRAAATITAPKVNAAAAIIDAAGGVVQYTWAATDLDTPGTYDAEFEIAWGDGGIETVPNAIYLPIEVIDDLDD